MICEGDCTSSCKIIITTVSCHPLIIASLSLGLLLKEEMKVDC